VVPERRKEREMKRKFFSLGFIMLLVWMFSLAFGSGLAQASAKGELPAKGKWREAVVLSAQETGTDVSLLSFSRKQLVDNIFSYTLILKVGPGEFDKIGVHRVVKERAPWVPIAAPKAVMLVHGDASNFDTSFLGSTLSDRLPVSRSLGIFLAQNDVDVWGVDRRWTFVPDGTTDFSFMKDWNTALHVSDIRIGVKIARLVRGLTGSGFGKLLMLGHSRGAQFAYAYANDETQIPKWCRDLKGIIPVDMVYKFSPQDQDLKDAAYERYLTVKDKYDREIYYSDEAAVMKYIAYLAVTAPDDPSPIIPGFTNKQAALFVLSATYATFDPDPEPPDIKPYVPFYHYLAGTFDENGIPQGLQFTNFDFVLDIALATPSFMSIGEDIDGEALMSDMVDVPYDDHLGEIKIPVFYVGAAGGFGEYGVYTVTLLGSTDKSTLVVKLYPPEAVALDYGHADLLWADNAESLVWQPIYEWIGTH